MGLRVGLGMAIIAFSQGAGGGINLFPVSAPTRAWLSGRASNPEWGYKVLGAGNPRVPPPAGLGAGL